MMNKIKIFFKKFWWIFLVPIGLFTLALVTRKPFSEVKKEIDQKKKEIEDTEKEIEKVSHDVEKATKELDQEIEKTKETIKKNLDDKGEREKEAEKFFPNIKK